MTDVTTSFGMRDTALPAQRADSAELQRKFDELTTRWRQETGPLSSVSAKAMHPAYQQIIGMGPVVLPLILHELEKQPEQWFWALRAITGIDPVPIPNRGRLKEMTHAWLQWGKEHGFIA